MRKGAQDPLSEGDVAPQRQAQAGTDPTPRQPGGNLGNSPSKLGRGGGSLQSRTPGWTGSPKAPGTTSQRCW